MVSEKPKFFTSLISSWKENINFMLSKNMLKDFFMKAVDSVQRIGPQILAGLPIFIALRAFVFPIPDAKFRHISSLVDLLVNLWVFCGSSFAPFSLPLPLALSFFSALFLGGFLLKRPDGPKNWPYFKSIAYRSILFALYLMFLYLFSIAIASISNFLISAYLNKNMIYYQNIIIICLYVLLRSLIITIYPFTIFFLLYNGFLFNIEIEKQFYYFISLKKSVLFYFYNMPFFMVFSSILFISSKILLYINLGYIGYFILDIIFFTTLVVLTTNFYILRTQKIPKLR